MRVEILVTRGRYQKGKIVDLPEILAGQLIDSGIAKAETKTKLTEGEKDEQKTKTKRKRIPKQK